MLNLLEVTINRLKEKVREYEDKIEETAKVPSDSSLLSKIVVLDKVFLNVVLSPYR